MLEEKDFLDVALFEQRNAILDAFWEKAVKTKSWTNHEGKITTIEKLDSPHLMNIVKMLLRFYQQRPSKYLITLINILLDEVGDRIDSFTGPLKENLEDEYEN